MVKVLSVAEAMEVAVEDNEDVVEFTSKATAKVVLITSPSVHHQIAR